MSDQFKERPILFSALMVRALLNGSKTQTRRAMKPQMVYGDVCGLFPSWYLPTSETGGILWPNAKDQIVAMCPYGQPGDRLYVRETFAEIDCRLTYKADTDDGAHCMVKRWTPSIHMPRAASRIQLEIVSVRVERLNACGEGDARAEGVNIEDRHMNGYCAGEFLPPAIRSYRDLWNDINGAGSWDANPWVWVIEFRRVEP